MKKAISMVLSIVILFVLVAGNALAGGGTWTCPTCGKEIDGDYNFCPYDGAGKTVANGPWPVEDYSGVPVKLAPLQDPEGRHSGYFGPDKNTYNTAGGYKPKHVTSAAALFREGDYILVDLYNKNTGRRCVYFKYSTLTDNDAAQIVLTGHKAETTTLLTPKYGPGSEYESLTQNKPSKYADWTVEQLVGQFGGSGEIWEALQPTRNSIYLDQGTEISVFFEMRGWVFAEFNCDLGLVRAWLPAMSVKAK